jgi:hypothetical protein
MREGNRGLLSWVTFRNLPEGTEEKVKNFILYSRPQKEERISTSDHYIFESQPAVNLVQIYHSA